MEKTEVKAASFTLDMSNTIYKGYHDPSETWNGWAIPFFTKEEAERIARDMNAENSEDKFNWLGDVLIRSQTGEDDEEIKPQHFYVDGKAIPMYCIGGWEWTWSVLSSLVFDVIKFGDVDSGQLSKELVEAIKEYGIAYQDNPESGSEHLYSISFFDDMEAGEHDPKLMEEAKQLKAAIDAAECSYMRLR